MSGFAHGIANPETAKAEGKSGRDSWRWIVQGNAERQHRTHDARREATRVRQGTSSAQPIQLSTRGRGAMRTCSRHILMVVIDKATGPRINEKARTEEDGDIIRRRQGILSYQKYSQQYW